MHVYCRDCYKECYFRNSFGHCTILNENALDKNGNCKFRKTKDDLKKQDKMTNAYIEWMKEVGTYRATTDFYYSRGRQKSNKQLFREFQNDLFRTKPGGKKNDK